MHEALAGVDLQQAGRGGQLPITNACFHIALLLSLLVVRHANGYSGFFPPLLLIYRLSLYV